VHLVVLSNGGELVKVVVGVGDMGGIAWGCGTCQAVVGHVRMCASVERHLGDVGRVRSRYLMVVGRLRWWRELGAREVLWDAPFCSWGGRTTTSYTCTSPGTWSPARTHSVGLVVAEEVVVVYEW
jgi:hypothetical protein